MQGIGYALMTAEKVSRALQEHTQHQARSRSPFGRGHPDPDEREQCSHGLQGV
jgi:hypothetical protein